MKLLSLIALTLLNVASPAPAINLLDADEFGADFEHYGHVYRLIPLQSVPFPVGRFEVTVRPGRRFSGVGLLHPRYVLEDGIRYVDAIAKIDRGTVASLETNMRFLEKDKTFTRLTAQQAQRLWGPPRIVNSVHTYDVHNFHHGEQNIFHLDFLFDDKGFVKSYRVRGICISEPLWIGPGREGSDGNNLVHRDAESVPVCISQLAPVKEILSRVPIKCSGESTIFFCSKGYRGWIEKLDDAAKQTNNGKLTLQDLSNRWGMPRARSRENYSFDVNYDNAGEPDIYHVNVFCNANFEIIRASLSGPGITLSEYVDVK